MIKSFDEYNTINEASQFTDEQFQAVADHIGDLETVISNELKFKVKLNISKGPKRINISSNDILHNSKDPLLNAMFTSLTIEFWGGDYIENENCFWYNPKIMWNTVTNGGNGTQFIWNSIKFMLDTNTWEFDKIR